MTMVPSLIAIAGLLVLIGGAIGVLGGGEMPQPIPVPVRRPGARPRR
jgi:hypothetical protein